jgi:NTP pyrophosphatase (non-canonical NTP hydrolase)
MTHLPFDPDTTFKAYQQFTPSTAVYHPKVEEDYIPAGLAGEVGELMSALAKYNRGDFDLTELWDREQKEIGDIMWFISQWCNMRGYDLDNIVVENMEKLKSRQERGVLKGDGDNR